MFGVSASPFLLNATIQYHLDCYAAAQPEVVRLLKQSMYVDDVICGADSEREVFVLYTAAKEILRHAYFNLRKFTTNAASLMDAHGATQKSSQASNPVVEAEENPPFPQAQPSALRSRRCSVYTGI